MGGKGVRKTRRQYVTLRKAWTEADARAQLRKENQPFMGGKGVRKTRRQYVTSRKAPACAEGRQVDENQCRAQRSNGEKDPSRGAMRSEAFRV